MDGEMTTSTQTTETVATTSAETSTGAAGQAAGAENGNQEKASAFKDFLDGLFGTKQEKKETGAEEKAAEKGAEPPAGKTEEKSFSQADMDAAIEKAKQDWEAQAEEAKRQAKLSPEEKAAEEQKKKDDQIADLQAKLLKSDLQKKATASLEKDGYPVGLADLLDYTSEEAMEKSLSNVWYMERFNFAPERVNPSNPVQRLSFYEVTNERNRELLQEYMKYQVGISDLALGNIRSQLCYIKKFLVYFNTIESICEITEEQIAEYFKLLQEQEIKAETVNRQIFDIHRFFAYLNVKGHIKGQIFDQNYYSQKVYPYHHDRSVQEDEYMEILKKLKFFPEVQRLIFLNLWATGLRISEVCTLKGDAYYWDGEDAWIKVYQIKMKAEKMIPISLVLYRIMKIYIKKHHIKSTDFLFNSKDGGAYRIGTFVKGFKASCKKYGIYISGETFKTHDYRHTLASSFYDDGVSIQTIRDYLGHNNENMTKQYIDY